MSINFDHEQPADSVELFYKQTNKYGDVLYEAVPFSLDKLEDPHLLIRTTSNSDGTFCRYYPVRLLTGLNAVEVPYFAEMANDRLQAAIKLHTPAKRRWWRKLLGK